MANKEYTSNLINNPEYTKRFTEEALKVANLLSKKYYSLFHYMSSEDIVMECWDKILRQDISFDDTKRCKFESFVRMIVNSRCIDMCRKIEKFENDLSLDCPLQSDETGQTTLENFIPNFKSESMLNGVEIRSIIDSFSGELYNFPISEILTYIYEGHSVQDISKKLNVKQKDIKKVVNEISGTFKRRYLGSDKTLEDFLFGDEHEMMEHKDEIVAAVSYISDPSGVKLSDVVEMVLDGFSYDDISNTLGKDKLSIKGFLESCLSLIV